MSAPETLRPTTRAGWALLSKEALNSRSFTLINGADIIAIEQEAAAAARAEADALRAALEEGRRRAADLRDCNKDDDCHVMAKGAALVIEDIEYALSPSPAEGESR